MYAHWDDVFMRNPRIAKYNRLLCIFISILSVKSPMWAKSFYIEKKNVHASKLTSIPISIIPSVRLWHIYLHNIRDEILIYTTIDWLNSQYQHFVHYLISVEFLFIKRTHKKKISKKKFTIANDCLHFKFSPTSESNYFTIFLQRCFVIIKCK